MFCLPALSRLLLQRRIHKCFHLPEVMHFKINFGAPMRSRYDTDDRLWQLRQSLRKQGSVTVQQAGCDRTPTLCKAKAKNKFCLINAQGCFKTVCVPAGPPRSPVSAELCLLLSQPATVSPRSPSQCQLRQRQAGASLDTVLRPSQPCGRLCNCYERPSCLRRTPARLHQCPAGWQPLARCLHCPPVAIMIFSRHCEARNSRRASFSLDSESATATRPKACHRIATYNRGLAFGGNASACSIGRLAGRLRKSSISALPSAIPDHLTAGHAFAVTNSKPEIASAQFAAAIPDDASASGCPSGV